MIRSLFVNAKVCDGYQSECTEIKVKFTQITDMIIFYPADSQSYYQNYGDIYPNY